MALPSFTISQTPKLADIIGDVVGADLVAQRMKDTEVLFTSNVDEDDLIVFEGDLHRIRPVLAYINSAGAVERDYKPVQLLANDPDLNVEGIQWTVEIRVADRVVKKWTFDAPAAGENLNLATVAPVPASLPNGVTRGARTYWVPVDPEDPDTLYQSVDEYGDPVGDPIPLSQIISVAAASVAGLDDVVVGLLAADGTVVDAAAAAAVPAVTAEIAGRDMLEGDDPRVPQDVSALTDLVWAWTDEDGLIAIGVDTSGHTWMRLRDDVEIARVPDLVDGHGMVYAITDADGLQAFGIDSRGWVRIGAFDEATQSIIGDIARSAVKSGPEITCIGDSLTYGYTGATPAPYTATLQTLLPTAVITNLGVTGETSFDMAARIGAVPMLVTVSGGSIPTSGGVTVTRQAVHGVTVEPNSTSPSTFWADVTIAGVHGALTWTSIGGTYTFTRTTAGSAVTVNGPQPVINNYGRAHLDDILIIWAGQNDGPSDPQNAQSRNYTAAMIQEMTAANKRFLVMNRVSGGNYDDDTWFALWGRRYLSPRAMLRDYGLAEMGITPTAQDTIDIAAGIIPESLRSDATHLNANGYTALGRFIYRRLVELGWV